jgi:hypothetical protein
MNSNFRYGNAWDTNEGTYCMSVVMSVNNLVLRTSTGLKVVFVLHASFPRGSGGDVVIWIPIVPPLQLHYSNNHPGVPVKNYSIFRFPPSKLVLPNFGWSNFCEQVLRTFSF